MKQKLRSIIKLAFPYVVLMLLPILSVILLSTYILRSHTKQAITDQTVAITTAVDRVDQKLSGIADLSYLLADGSNLFTYVFHGITGLDSSYQEVDQIQDLLSGAAQNEDIAELYFYDAQNGRIIAPQCSLSDARMYFRYRYQFRDRTPEEALERLQSYRWGYSYSAVEEVEVDNRTVDVLEYRVSVPVHKYGAHQSQLVFALDAESLFRDLYDTLFEEAEFYICDNNGLLYSNGTAYQDLLDSPLPKTLEKLKGVKGTVYGMDRSLNGGTWQVKLFFPELHSVNRGQDILAQMMPAIILPVVLSICLCVFFTHKNHKNIAEILTLLRGGDTQDEPWEQPQFVDHDMLRSYASRLAEKTSAYQSKLEDFQQSQTRNVLERLVRNAYHSQQEKRKDLSQVCLQVGDEHCAAVCIQLSAVCNDFVIADNITIHDLIIDLLNTHIRARMEVFDNLPTEIVCILATDKDYQSAVEEIISTLNVQVQYPYGTELRIGVGNPVASVFQIHQSFEQAREVIRYGESVGKNVRYYDQIHSLEAVAFYPVLTDDKISNYMIAGQADEAKNIIHTIYNENFGDGKTMLSMDAISLVKYRITNAVTVVAEKQGIPIRETVSRLYLEKSTRKYFVALTQLVDIIVSEIMARKNSTQNNIATKVREYMLEHYADCGLSIRQIAGVFHFHENYISNLYKEEYGESLSYAIERLRIDKACELLKTTDIRVGQVATMVGYSSDSSFRRAFKKIKGISPADYRSTQ